MVTSSGYALLAALLPWIVCSIRGVLEPEGSDPEEVPKDEDRLQCLRQDNLDLVGTADFASRYILRQVVGVNEDDTESDIYLFADKFRISRVQAELKLSRTGADALAFELVGSNSTEKHTGLGSADMRIREFQLVTRSSVISCATSLASSLAEDCDDPEEQRLCLALTMLPKRGFFLVRLTCSTWPLFCVSLLNLPQWPAVLVLQAGHRPFSPRRDDTCKEAQRSLGGGHRYEGGAGIWSDSAGH